jgi:preprotein translocase subunit SecG
MEQVLLVVQVIIAAALIIMVLIQRSDSDGFGLGGGGGNGLLSGRGQANLMTRTTAILAALFIINSLALGVIAARSHDSSIMDTIEAQQPDADALPAVPLAGEKKPEKPASKAAVKKDDASATDEAPSVPAAEADVKPAAKAKPAKKEAAEPEQNDGNSDNN